MATTKLSYCDVVKRSSPTSVNIIPQLLDTNINVNNYVYQHSVVNYYDNYEYKEQKTSRRNTHKRGKSRKDNVIVKSRFIKRNKDRNTKYKDDVEYCEKEKQRIIQEVDVFVYTDGGIYTLHKIDHTRLPPHRHCADNRYVNNKGQVIGRNCCHLYL